MLILPSLAQLLAWGLLLASLATAFIRPKLWPWLLGSCLLAAAVFHYIAVPTLLLSLLFFSLAFAVRHSQGRLQAILVIAVILFALALCGHLLPGFQSLLVLDNVRSGPLSRPYSLSMSLDKPLLFFCLLIMLPTLLDKHRTDWNKPLLACAILILFGLQLLALFSGMVKVEWSVPYWIAVFAISNLLLTCVVEEALFRGAIQHYLCRWLGLWPGLLLASAVFGVAHFNGGPLFMLFATIAGLAYGLSYQASGRLWAAIFIHFGFNLSHLLWLTYPLAR